MGSWITELSEEKLGCVSSKPKSDRCRVSETLEISLLDGSKNVFLGIVTFLFLEFLHFCVFFAKFNQ